MITISHYFKQKQYSVSAESTLAFRYVSQEHTIFDYCIEFLLCSNKSFTEWLKLQYLTTYIPLPPRAFILVSKEMALDEPTVESKLCLASVLNASPDGCLAAVAAGL